MFSNAEETDIDFEPEDELGSTGAFKAKLQKLRDELAEVKKERQEYLGGWQRAKADLINARKEASDMIQRAQSTGRETLIEELIPALDSFDMAMSSDAWNTVDTTWRAGIEGIRAQFLNVLSTHGIEVFGTVGDAFDPLLHEAAQEVSGSGVSDTIAKVLRSGYRAKGRILRAAQVIIFK
jgi:molecular chaperone GrpE